MRSFDYFATFDESISILRDLCAQGFKVVAEPYLFDEPKAPIFDEVTDELVELLRVAPAHYLAGAFTRFPVQFMQLKEGPNAGKYSINLLVQGPLIQGLLSRINPVDHVQRLLPGQISHQDAYKNPETNAWDKPAPDLKAAFRQAVSTIKKRCIRYTYKPGIDIFIGTEACEVLKSGKVQIKDSQIIPAGR